MLVGIGEDIRSLDGLGEVTEDVVDEEDGFCCVGGASDILRRGLAGVRERREEGGWKVSCYLVPVQGIKGTYNARGNLFQIMYRIRIRTSL